MISYHLLHCYRTLYRAVFHVRGRYAYVRRSFASVGTDVRKYVEIEQTSREKFPKTETLCSGTSPKYTTTTTRNCIYNAYYT